MMWPIKTERQSGLLFPKFNISGRNGVELGLPVFIAAMSEMIENDPIRAHLGQETVLWAQLVLATPVVFWSGWQFHASAVKALRHGTTTMDTLVSMGTLAAWGWSVISRPCTMGAGKSSWSARERLPRA